MWMVLPCLISRVSPRLKVSKLKPSFSNRTLLTDAATCLSPHSATQACCGHHTPTLTRTVPPPRAFRSLVVVESRRNDRHSHRNFRIHSSRLGRKFLSTRHEACRLPFLLRNQIQHR